MKNKSWKSGALLLALALLATGPAVAGQQAPDGYSMPGFSPYYGPPPVHFRGNRIVSVMFRTTPEALLALLPKPLQPNPFQLAFVYVGRLSIVGAGGGSFEYLEAGIGIPASLGVAHENFAVCLYLNEAMPIVAGREIWGWPKKDAKITLTEKNGAISGRVERLGSLLIELDARLAEKTGPAPAQPELPWLLQKIVPAVRQGAPPEVQQLVVVRNVDIRNTERWNCTASLKLDSGPEDKLGAIPVLQIVGAQLSVGDFTMGYGDVLYDYLKKSE